MTLEQQNKYLRATINVLKEKANKVMENNEYLLLENQRLKADQVKQDEIIKDLSRSLKVHRSLMRKDISLKDTKTIKIELDITSNQPIDIRV